VPNDTLLQAVSDRLTAFQLALQSDGCTPEQAQSLRDGVFSALTAATVGWDSAELENEAPTLLTELMHECWDRLDFHTVKEFVTSQGETIECRSFALADNGFAIADRRNVL
jgi:hypothetical protein